MMYPLPLVALLALPSCGWLSTDGPFEAPEGWTVHRLDGDDYRGLSGLDVDAKGQLWAIPERQPYLVRIDPEAGAFRERLLVHGVQAGLDTEAVAFGAKDVVWFGTESPDAERSGDVVLKAKRTGTEVRVTQTLVLPFEPLALKAERNRGVEGVCVADDVLVVSSELIASEGGRRWSPIALRPSLAKGWTFGRVAMQSDTGKISALDCVRDGDHIVVTMMERHFGVVRISEARVPLTGGDSETRLLLDVGAATTGHLPNFEGLVRVPTGLWLLTDNDYAGRTRDTLLVHVPLSALSGGGAAPEVER